ncbi:phospholipase D-like domain-containing protein [Nocardioides donggukensis]|uniref:phospholipase D n=1 Tax=Nocardioides donggukensis TaxID=2774019 RepID=A0A927K5C0_9ACTN|nr:phospholipase D-like domain-containing protein [Nocardioides donggukensis]MBD8871032.1 hypothetical protein [Nocardioides donggukensis]
MFRRTVVPAALSILLPLLVVGAYSGGSASASPAPATAPLSVEQVRGQSANIARLARVGLKRTAPGRTTPAGGPSFNNPNGGTIAKRRNLDRIYRMVQSTLGYKVKSPSQCPQRRELWPNEIKIALYSFSDPKVADALIRAHRRCVSVQILMNDHLSNSDVPAFGRVQRALGGSRKNRSWARRCKKGCRGYNGPLHSKIFLFSNVRKATDVVTVGSSNMTGKAAKVQWNDLFVFKGRQKLYNQYQTIFKEMKRDKVAPAPIERNYRAGAIKSMFWPQPGHTKTTDRVMKVLRSVHCDRKPTGGTGYAGKTAVAINIHAMEGDRGYYIARKIVSMRKAGCRVRVLYGLIAPRIHKRFKAGGVATRRTIFDRDKNGYTEMYSHMKMVAINGNVGKESGDRVVYTGSENFSHRTVGADEVWVRIPWTKMWRKYMNNFDMVWKSDFYSNPKYAHYRQSGTPIHAREAPPEDGAILVTQEDLEG